MRQTGGSQPTGRKLGPNVLRGFEYRNFNGTLIMEIKIFK
jgi:hypothetical protein